MNVLIRADSSVRVGAGHIMRCLTLAQALRERDASVRFVCRDWQGHLGQSITQAGFQIHLLPPLADVSLDGSPVGEQQPDSVRELTRQDAEQTADILQNLPSKVECLVVDHYLLEREWENAIRPFVSRLMVIDDLADRDHQCDLLLDQTLGRQEQDYRPHVPDSCRLLLGPSYALLRHEFAGQRETALGRRGNAGAVGRILVSMGGMDPDNVTGTVLAALARIDLQAEVDVVLGRGAPHIEAVKSLLASSAFPARLHVGVDDMAGLMTEADLAIGAGGVTSWERCCLGLPSLIIVTANNQDKIAAELDRAGAARLIGRHPHVNVSTIAESVEGLIRDRNYRVAMSRAASRVCDGQGASRVVEVLAA